MTYYANYDANNGTHWARPITDTNKARIIRRIRRTAEAERYSGNECSWEVWIINGRDCNGDHITKTIASGGMLDNCQRYRLV